jgi:hypothetical protein
MGNERRGGLIWAAILIAVGVVLLLNNLGWTAITVWDLLRLWPVLLVAVGLDLLIGRRSAWGSIAVLIVLLLLIGGGLWLLSSTGPVRSLTGEEVAIPLQGATQGSVDIGFGAGELRVDTSAAVDQLLVGTVDLFRGEQVERSVDLQSGTLSAILRSRGQWSAPLFAWGGQPEWELGVSREVPLRLRVEGGVGDMSIDLRRTLLTELDVKLGVGRVVVALPSEGGYAGRLDNGIGLLLVRVPPGLGVRIQASTGLGSVSVPSGYRKDGGTYLSPGYQDAEERVDLSVETGIGLTRVETYEGQ